jgi:hypothetical protein
LIKSQVLYQLSYAPLEVRGLRALLCQSIGG